MQTALESERSKILKNVTNKEGYESMPKVLVENHPDGVYVKQYDIHSKYERRPIEGSEEVEALEEICLAQFVKMYEPFWGKKAVIKRVDKPEKYARLQLDLMECWWPLACLWDAEPDPHKESHRGADGRYY